MSNSVYKTNVSLLNTNVIAYKCSITCQSEKKNIWNWTVILGIFHFHEQYLCKQRETFIWLFIYFPEKKHPSGLAIRQTTQNNISIPVLTGSVEERINTSIDVWENTMEYFLKNLNYSLRARDGFIQSIFYKRFDRFSL